MLIKRRLVLLAYLREANSMLDKRDVVSKSALLSLMDSNHRKDLLAANNVLEYVLEYEPTIVDSIETPHGQTIYPQRNERNGRNGCGPPSP